MDKDNGRCGLFLKDSKNTGTRVMGTKASIQNSLATSTTLVESLMFYL